MKRVFSDIRALRPEVGWVGAFTRAEVPGAFANATRVAKRASEPGDGQANGTLGTVLGSFSDPRVHGGGILYFVEWDTAPKVAVAVIDFKLEKV